MSCAACQAIRSELKAAVAKGKPIEAAKAAAKGAAHMTAPLIPPAIAKAFK